MGEPMKTKMSATSTKLPRMAVTVPAYAKINLTLELLGVRPDGYHAIRSVVVPVELHDDVEISVHPSPVTRHSSLAPTSSVGTPTLEVVADGVSISNLGPAESNLAVRAARLFFDRLGLKRGNREQGTGNGEPPFSTPLCASASSASLRDKNRPAPLSIEHCALCIRLTKRIPLGGGSADAAAVLLGLNSLVTRHSSLVTSNSPTPPLPHFSTQELMEMGALLGSDIPAMVNGGTVLMEGRGEVVTPVRDAAGRSPLPSMAVLLANPGTHVSTAEAYRESNAVLTSSAFSCNILSSPNCVGSASACAAWLFNGLERAVFARHPEVAALAARLREAGAAAVLMSGSGATVFALADSTAEAERLARALPDGCWWTVTRTLPDGVMAAHGPLEA